MGTAKLSVQSKVIEQLFRLPEGYIIDGAEYDHSNNCINFSLASHAISGDDLRARLIIHSEHLHTHPEYQKLTGEIDLS